MLGLIILYLSEYFLKKLDKMKCRGCHTYFIAQCNQSPIFNHGAAWSAISFNSSVICYALNSFIATYAYNEQ
jgi:lipoprotein signal peptidase